MGGMSNAHPAHFFVRAFLAADHSWGRRRGGACGPRACQKIVGCLLRCCRSVGMSFVLLSKVCMLGCVHRASSQLRASFFSSWRAAWIYVRENAVRIRGGLNGAKTCNSVMKDTLVCEPHFRWSSAVDLMCRKLNWMNYRCVCCAALMQFKAV